MEGRFGLREAPLQVIAGNGVLVVAHAVDRLESFLLRLQNGRECAAVGFEDGLRIKGRVVMQISCMTGVGSAAIIPGFVCSARKFINFKLDVYCSYNINKHYIVNSIDWGDNEIYLHRKQRNPGADIAPDGVDGSNGECMMRRDAIRRIVPLTAILDHIRSLELFAARGGARLVREILPDWVCGRVSLDLITLHAGLSPEQELLTLVHELTHWLAHRDQGPGPQCTLYEYEAEAVEAIVMGQLGLKYPSSDTPTCIREPHGWPTGGLRQARAVGERSNLRRSGARGTAAVLRGATPRPPRDNAR